MKLTLLINLLVLCTLMVSCQKSDDEPAALCEEQTIIDGNLYASSVSPGDLVINSAVTSGDCLVLSVSSGGCDGSTWVFTLVDANAILESDPPQRRLKLLIRNDELCDAFITRYISFDVSNLQSGEGPVLLDIENFGKVRYEY